MMNSACEIMKDAIVKDFLPKLEAQAGEAYDTADYQTYSYITKCVDRITEGVAIGVRNDVSEAAYWEDWHILARNTLSTLAIRQCVKDIKRNLKNK